MSYATYDSHSIHILLPVPTINKVTTHINATIEQSPSPIFSYRIRYRLNLQMEVSIHISSWNYWCWVLTTIFPQPKNYTPSMTIYMMGSKFHHLRSVTIIFLHVSRGSLTKDKLWHVNGGNPNILLFLYSFLEHSFQHLLGSLFPRSWKMFKIIISIVLRWHPLIQGNTFVN